MGEESPRTKNARIYGWQDGVIPETGAEVWVRATVIDPCTSCCGVRVVGSMPGQFVSLYMKPGDVRSTSEGGGK